MSKREWAIALLPLLVTLMLDQFTKRLATGLTSTEAFGPLVFSLHFNSGAILGAFSNLPSVLRIVSLATGGAFVFFLFLLFHIILPTPSLLIRSGVSIVVGGILGNVLDRIANGYVIDFWTLNLGWVDLPIFNLADAFQWVGYVVLVCGLILEGNTLWPDQCTRKRYMINPHFQVKHSFLLTIYSIGLSAVLGTYSYTFLKVAAFDKTLQAIDESVIRTYLITFIFISLASSALLFFSGIIMSHRIAGPVFAFQRYIDQLLSGHNSKFSLRKNDEFKELEVTASRLEKICQRETLRKTS